MALHSENSIVRALSYRFLLYFKRVYFPMVHIRESAISCLIFSAGFLLRYRRDEKRKHPRNENNVRRGVKSKLMINPQIIAPGQ